MPEDAFDAENFPEEAYLIAFGDVRMAVVAGAFESGFQHYQSYGRAEIEAGIRHSPFEAPAGSPTIATSRSPADKAAINCGDVRQTSEISTCG